MLPIPSNARPELPTKSQITERLEKQRQVGKPTRQPASNNTTTRKTTTPLKTCDGGFMVGDTSWEQDRVEGRSERKSQRIFKRIDKNKDGKLSNSEICDYRDEETRTSIGELLALPFRMLTKKGRKNVREEAVMKHYQAGKTKEYRNIPEKEAEHNRIVYDRLHSKPGITVDEAKEKLGLQC